MPFGASAAFGPILALWNHVGNQVGPLGTTFGTNVGLLEPIVAV